MTISPAVWQALRRSVERDDQQTFEQLVDAIAAQEVRDETARRAVADRRRAGQPAWIASCR